MNEQEKLDAIFQSDLRYLMLVSYIVLGNNAVTNRFIERTYRMPVQAWSALFAIVMFPGIRAKEIRHLFPRPQNTLSRAVALLEDRDLIEQQASAADGREKRLFATATGKELLAEIRAVSVRRQEELFSPLNDQERETFFQLARKIAAGPGLLQTTTMETGQHTAKGNENEPS
ncbi:MarR family winged helix-turn-helix transcriptional regulator [Sedimentitalea todarodis]|uniref:MarR family winged helix-turn-helix transcriptional regulator n=1 Tax=Sedimentitalea todarodis TaxID=1631240 RepID=A0ABU3VE15_9RHOB|nr:MarR family winged helix-turn-helix transcriptional regulator [Sedimentitalea todarodis]MDU9004413.1 MarR family winged helix-turn-helix transcriptional regulator [Sedimentitalea todarodis]